MNAEMRFHDTTFHGLVIPEVPAASVSCLFVTLGLLMIAFGRTSKTEGAGFDLSLGQLFCGCVLWGVLTLKMFHPCFTLIRSCLHQTFFFLQHSGTKSCRWTRGCLCVSPRQKIQAHPENPSTTAWWRDHAKCNPSNGGLLAEWFRYQWQLGWALVVLHWKSPTLGFQTACKRGETPECGSSSGGPKNPTFPSFYSRWGWECSRPWSCSMIGASKRQPRGIHVSNRFFSLHPPWLVRTVMSTGS